MSKTFVRLSLQEKKEIARYIKYHPNLSLTQIAAYLGRSKNCITTEVRNNGGKQNYCPFASEKRYLQVMKKGREKCSEKTKGIRHRGAYLLRIENLEMQMEILHETIQEILNEQNK